MSQRSTTKIIMSTRAQLIEQAHKEFPRLPRHVIEVTVDCYLADAKGFTKRMDVLRKNEKNERVPARTTTTTTTTAAQTPSVSVMTFEEFIASHPPEKVKELINLPAEYSNTTEPASNRSNEPDTVPSIPT